MPELRLDRMMKMGVALLCARFCCSHELNESEIVLGSSAREVSHQHQAPIAVVSLSKEKLTAVR